MPGPVPGPMPALDAPRAHVAQVGTHARAGTPTSWLAPQGGVVPQRRQDGSWRCEREMIVRRLKGPLKTGWVTTRGLSAYS